MGNFTKAIKESWWTVRRALIIEDESEIQNILSDVLKLECGFEIVDSAFDGLDGYLKIMTEKYDIICLDQKMPYCNGTEVLMALRNKDGINKNTTVLFISAFLPQIPEDLRKSEGTFYLEKPIDFTRFIRYVKMSGMK